MSNTIRIMALAATTAAFGLAGCSHHSDDRSGGSSSSLPNVATATLTPGANGVTTTTGPLTATALYQQDGNGGYEVSGISAGDLKDRDLKFNSNGILTNPNAGERGFLESTETANAHAAFVQVETTGQTKQLAVYNGDTASISAKSGKATYQGDFVGGGYAKNAGTTVTGAVHGTASVSADFAADKVTGRMSGLTVQDEFVPGRTAAVGDISFNGSMSRDSSSVVTGYDTTDVTIAGDGTSHGVGNGDFFGHSGNQNQVAGTLSVVGADTGVTGVYTATQTQNNLRRR